MRRPDADRLLRFVRAGHPLAVRAVAVTRSDDGDTRAHADRLVGHWRREVAPLTALPGLGGRLAGAAVEVLAATAQGLLVLSLAVLQGVEDERELVRLVALVALDEQLPTDWSPATADADGSDDDADDGDEETAVWLAALRRVPTGMVAVAREMWAVRRLTGKRSSGRLWHRAVGFLPVVGVAGTLLGETAAVDVLAARAYAELGIPAARGDGAG